MPPSYEDALDSPLPRARVALAAPSVDGGGARARRVAVPEARVGGSLPFPAAAGDRLPAVAHAHRVWGRERRPSGGRRHPLRALGDQRSVIGAWAPEVPDRTSFP